ncbi:ABC transporter substrate-binding protein [Arhodomonas aquaeolei]|uniref:ABC transporter substrate-binding protein n=1 Tax=Arhodomonas aquaeolei TaxID=2369 RepID=UPI002167EB95|nr:ABC transporter substrate-binding protein [Arhodomonas aquaeolei]MCS4502758.1 ABC transporter substrate-binding protein [Arhodomonas aquaeolei]
MPHGTLRRGLVILIALAVSACARNDTPTLRLAANAWPGYGYFYIAQKKGFTADAGIHLEIVDTLSLRDSRRAFERGQVDLLGGTPLELVQIERRSDRKARAVLMLDRSVGADVILARPPVTGVAGLRGRHVAVEPGSANLLVLAGALAHAGVPATGVRLAPMPQSSMAEALAEGEVSAAVTYPPFSKRMEHLDGVRRIFDTAAAPNAVIDILIASREVTRERTGALSRLIRAHQRALDWAADHPQEAAELLAHRGGQSSEEIREPLEQIHMIGLRAQRDCWGEDACLIRAVRRSVTALEAFDRRAITIDPRRLLDSRALERVASP